MQCSDLIIGRVTDHMGHMNVLRVLHFGLGVLAVGPVIGDRDSAWQRAVAVTVTLAVARGITRDVGCTTNDLSNKRVAVKQAGPRNRPAGAASNAALAAEVSLPLASSMLELDVLSSPELVWILPLALTSALASPVPVVLIVPEAAWTVLTPLTFHLRLPSPIP